MVPTPAQRRSARLPAIQSTTPRDVRPQTGVGRHLSFKEEPRWDGQNYYEAADQLTCSWRTFRIFFGERGDVRADGRGLGFYWKLEGGGGGSEEVAGGGAGAGSISGGGGG